MGGTAATVLAGLYGAMKVQGESPEHLKNQKIVVAGAGSAGSGVILTIRNAMINRAAEALVELINEDDLARRATFPENVDIREIACHLAAKVFEQAVEENLVISNKVMLEALKHGGLSELKEYIYSKMCYPDYRPLVYLPPGKGE